VADAAFQETAFAYPVLTSCAGCVRPRNPT
jgi:hypothetical protein